MREGSLNYKNEETVKLNQGITRSMLVTTSPDTAMGFLVLKLITKQFCLIIDFVSERVCGRLYKQF